MKYLSLFASTYGTGTYNTSVYNNATTSTTGSSSGTLVDTGFIVIGVVTVAVVIIFLALLVRFFKKPKMAAPPVATESKPKQPVSRSTPPTVQG